MEPETPDKYYIIIEKTVIDGKSGKGKYKVWRDDNFKEHRKLLRFEEDRTI